MGDDARELMERLLSQPRDSHFSCFDWMEQSGYTHEQRLAMLRLSSDINGAALDYLEQHPVTEWSGDDWRRYESSQWDCTEQMRTSLLMEGFTREQADVIAEAWEHERYTRHGLQDGCGRMHHCRFCKEAVV